MDSDLQLLRRKVAQQINRAAKEAKPRSQYTNGYIDALSRVVHLIDKINMDKKTTTTTSTGFRG